MVKWEWLKVERWIGAKWLGVEPAGRLGLQRLIQQYPKAKADVDKDRNSDRLSFGSQAECKGGNNK